MIMSTAQKLSITEQEYLEGELCSEIKHEFIDGQVYAMTGTSDDHNRISVNVLSELRQQLKGQPCEPFIADMMLKVDQSIFYPDVMVLYQPDDADTKLVKHSPTIVVEVLSPSTRRTDVTIKKSAYLSLPSLQEYVVIEQDKCEIQVFRRSDNWVSAYYFLGDEITFESIGITLSVEEIYDRVMNDDMTTFLAKRDEDSVGMSSSS